MAGAVPISASVLDWALRDANLSSSGLAERLDVSPASVEAWRQGRLRPTTGEFHALATQLRRPESFFFLPSPPRRTETPASFRSVPSSGSAADEVSSMNSAAVRAARRAQRISEWLVEKGVRERALIPASKGPNASAENAARVLNRWLASDSAWDRSGSDAAFARSVRSSLESRNLLAFHLSLGSEGWRGFSLRAPSAPLIAANTHYDYRPRVFTYLHELAHLSAQTESLCAVSAHLTYDRDLEAWCDLVAGAMLLPQPDVGEFVVAKFGHRKLDSIEDVRSVSNRFNASLRATAIRLLHLKLARETIYSEVDALARVGEGKRGGGGGADPRTTPRIRLQSFGEGYLRPLLAAEVSGKVTRSDTLEFLDVSGPQLYELRSLVPPAPARTDS